MSSLGLTESVPRSFRLLQFLEDFFLSFFLGSAYINFRFTFPDFQFRLWNGGRFFADLGSLYLVSSQLLLHSGERDV